MTVIKSVYFREAHLPGRLARTVGAQTAALTCHPRRGRWCGVRGGGTLASAPGLCRGAARLFSPDRGPGLAGNGLKAASPVNAAGAIRTSHLVAWGEQLYNLVADEMW